MIVAKSKAPVKADKKVPKTSAKKAGLGPFGAPFPAEDDLCDICRCLANKGSAPESFRVELLRIMCDWFAHGIPIIPPEVLFGQVKEHVVVAAADITTALVAITVPQNPLYFLKRLKVHNETDANIWISTVGAAPSVLGGNFYIAAGATELLYDNEWGYVNNNNGTFIGGETVPTVGGRVILEGY